MGTEFDEALDNGNSRFIKHLLALRVKRAQQQGNRGGQESGAAEAVGQGLGQVQEAEEQSGKS